MIRVLIAILLVLAVTVMVLALRGEPGVADI